MKDKLREITDSTINELLGNEIILPSNYFQCFDKNAKNIDIDLKSKDFEKELNQLILDEFDSINSYVNDAMKTIDNVADITKEAQKAIEQNDSLLLKNLYNQITTLKKELLEMTNNIYKDYLTKLYNKKWLYFKYLDEKANFKESAIVVLIDITDYYYISKTYNKLIANNLLIYISKSLNKAFIDEQLKFKTIRFLTNKLIIIFDEESLSQIKSVVNTISDSLFETTLQSNSGILIKPTFDYSFIEVKKNQSFHTSLESLTKKIKEEQNKIV